MSIAVIAAIAVFLGVLFILFLQQQKEHKLSRLVLIGLILGSAYGFLMQSYFGVDSPATAETRSWIAIVGGGYVALL